jgi:hypothetical protein
VSARAQLVDDRLGDRALVVCTDHDPHVRSLPELVFAGPRGILEAVN